MKTMKSTLLAALATICLVPVSVRATTINITPATVLQWTGTDNAKMSASKIDAFLLSAGRDVNGTLTESYKMNVGDASDSGPFASSYTTTFSNSSLDPADALIDYTSGSSIKGSEIFLYVKDGNHKPAFYIFDISAWNGTDDLKLTGFWPSEGAISHVAILTTPASRVDPPRSVPDGGVTIALLGFALLGLVGFRKMACCA